MQLVVLLILAALGAPPATEVTGRIFPTAKVSFGASGVELLSELSGQPTKILSIQKTR